MERYAPFVLHLDIFLKCRNFDRGIVLDRVLDRSVVLDFEL